MGLPVSVHTLPPGSEVPAAQRPLTQVVGHVAQVRLHHSGVQRQVVPQQLEVPGVVFKVRLWGRGERCRACPCVGSQGSR